MAAATTRGGCMFESPLRLRECSELLNQLKSLCTYLDDGDREVSTLSQITMVCNLLKELGANMDLGFEAQLDWCFAVFRNVSRDNQLGVVDRLRLIEVIELRSMGWKTDPAINEYYAFKYKKLDRRSAEDNNVLLEQQACVINQAQKSEQLFCEPVTKTRAPSARGTTVDLGGQLETPSVAHGETELWVRRITVGTEVAYVSGMSEGVVNMLTSAVQSLCPNVTADALLHTKQLPTLIPRDPAATLTGEVVASPMTYIQRSGDASDATSIQNTSDTSEVTNKHEINPFKRLESETERSSTGRHDMFLTNLKTKCSNDRPNQNKCFQKLGGAAQVSNGCSEYGFNSLGTANEKPDQDKCPKELLSSVQYTGSVDNAHEVSSAFKTSTTSSERCRLSHYAGHGHPAWLSSGDGIQLLYTDLKARRNAGEDSLERQFGKHKGLMQPPGNTENQKVELSGGFKKLSQAEQFEGPGIQPSSTTQSQTVPLVDKSLGNTNGIGYAKQYGTHGSSIQFSSKAVEHVRHTDFHALGVGDLPAKKKQPGVLASSKELRSTDDHQAVVPHPPKAAGQSRPDRKVYTREFLLECLHSPLAFEMPPDFPRLDPLVEWAMVRKDRIY
ncbi:hypothetical protein MRX96_044661 [Rhipicephalus microplus]